MYLRKLVVNNFRAFEHFEWEIAPGEEAGWHVLLGANGCGKSSLLKAIALAIVGDKQFFALRLPLEYFVRIGSDAAEISISLAWDETWDSWLTSEKEKAYPPRREIPISMTLRSSGIVSDAGVTDQTIWSDRPGWFSAAFGPMRRFSGGDSELSGIFRTTRRLARHLSLFGEAVALTGALTWLTDLHLRGLDFERGLAHGRGMRSMSSNAMPVDQLNHLDRVVRFINQDGFLPYGTRLESVSAKSVTFSDGNGAQIPIYELSDGFRAVLALTIELIRLIDDCHPNNPAIFGADDLTVVTPGIVLIDEIDAHLHPEWQRTIGPTLTKLFPNIQFIVTTHSPYICQNATPGSIWSLPAPGTDQPPKRITGEQLNKVLYGDILQILNSEAFGGMPGRSEAAGLALDRLAELNRLESQGKIDSTQSSERKLLSEKLAPVLTNEV